VNEKSKRQAFLERQIELSDFMEDHGFDPMGSSDIIEDFLTWAVTEDNGQPAEELFDKFRQSPVWSRYFG